jgi:DNA repair exonuclease SbcCD nuclease subunit
MAKAEAVEVIAIAGDLFHSNRIEQGFVDAVFGKIREANPIKVVFAAGNHDPLNAESPFLKEDLPSNLYVLGTNDDEITFEDLKLKVYGRSFESGSLKGEDAFSLPTGNDYINLLVQHGELKSDLNSEFNAITPKFVKNSGMDYIALGHVHKRSEIGKIDNTYFAYCGCPEGQGFDELDDKGVYLGEIGKGICELEFISVSKRKHIHQKIDITDVTDIPTHILTVLENTHKNYTENLYKIELTGFIPEGFELNKNELLARLSTRLYFVKIKDSTEYKIDYQALSRETSLKGVFVKNMLNKIKENPNDNNLKKALKLGLKAFGSEVKYSED